MRLRAGLRREAQRVFGEVDLLALPTTAETAMAATDAEMATGFTDTLAIDALCRFTFFANLTGLPAGTSPVGKDARGLPIGFQLVGDAWDEGGRARGDGAPRAAGRRSGGAAESRDRRPDRTSRLTRRS